MPSAHASFPARRAAAALAAATACLAAAAAGPPADRFDIVGLRLGMSVDEATAALRAHDPAAKIREHRRSIVYSDGVEHGLRSEDFLHYLSAGRLASDGNPEGDEGLSVFFAPKPMQPRVTAIVRTLSRLPRPPTGKEYADALVAKYGPPQRQDGSGRLRWEFPAGKSNCMVSDQYEPAYGKSILIPIFGNPAGQPAVFQKREFTDLAGCAAQLEYTVGLPQQPVQQARAVLLDVEATARGELAVNRWASELAQSAAQARASKGKTPKL